MARGRGTKVKKKPGIIGFYRRKLVFFALAMLLAFWGFRYLTTSKFSADTDPIINGYSGSNLNISVEVEKNGKIIVDGKQVSQKINLLDDADEVRLLLVDNPGASYDKVKINLTLPEAVAGSTDYRIMAIHGVGGSSATAVDSSHILFQAEDVSSYASVSVIAKMPKGTINPPLEMRFKKTLTGMQLNVWLVVAVSLPIATLVFMILFVLYRARRQRIDIPEREIDFPPMSLPPAVVGVLANQSVRSREIAATLIDLAVRGDIVIIDRERGFAFGKGKFDQRLLGYEKLLLSKIFQKSLSSDRAEIEKRINNHFYSKKISLVSAGVYALSTRLGYFKSNPQQIHGRFRLVGVLSLILGLIGFVLSLLAFTDPPYVAFFWIGMMLSALVIIFSASRIPIRSVLGQEALANWFAFKKFLSDSKPIPFEFSDRSVFERYLPYAVVLNCEAAWAKRFAEQNFFVPAWFLTDKGNLGLEDFCLSLFPIISYVSRSFAALREPGFE